MKPKISIHTCGCLNIVKISYLKAYIITLGYQRHKIKVEHTLTIDFHLYVILTKGLFKYFVEKTGAKAKNILILSAIFGIVENVMKPKIK